MGKKPSVKPITRREWFRRVEEGESALQIAEAEKYDVRTVRTQIEIERQEREKREARSMVLRNALEDHYKDICEYAQKLESLLNSERNTLPVLRENPMWTSLSQHLPRYKMWKNFDKWERIRDEMYMAEQELNMKLEKQLQSELKSESESEYKGSLKEKSLTPRMIEALASHIGGAAKGQTERLSEFDYRKMSEDDKPDALKLAKVILEKVPQWPEFDKLSLFWKELAQIKRELRDELEVIRLRRVVPGRCRYCPI